MTIYTSSAYEIGTESDLDYLIGPLRLHLGDTSSPFTYTDGALRRALVDGFKSLTVRWHSRYSIVMSGVRSELSPTFTISGVLYGQFTVGRLTSNWTFTDAEPPTIQIADERPIVLSAAIILKRGRLQALSGTYENWRDDEIAYSNLESSRALQLSIQGDIEELNSILPPRGKRLSKAQRQSLPGFTSDFNIYEG